jgi:hypothetical protein
VHIARALPKSELFDIALSNGSIGPDYVPDDDVYSAHFPYHKAEDQAALRMLYLIFQLKDVVVSDPSVRPLWSRARKCLGKSVGEVVVDLLNLP